MRITAIRERTVALQGNIANAVVNFSEHTVSLVAVVSDVIRNGKPVTGYAFDSIGRFGQGGILRERLIPRVLAAAPEALLDAGGTLFDPAKVLQVAMRNEKPGGHGDRAAAAGALELACWDLNAKLLDEPAYATIARHAGRTPLTKVPVYAAGGYYYPEGGTACLREEFLAYRAMGFTAFKMKIGGAPLAADLARIEAALAVAGDGAHLAVDANGRFDLATALDYAAALAPYELRWFEEIGDPLDYDLNRAVIAAYPGTVATGENLFSSADVANLVRYGGMRAGRDVFQMDPGLSYGLVAYTRMLDVLDAHGHARTSAHPHGGHMINLHIAAGLGLGGCEAYPGVFQPFGGYADACVIADGHVRPTDAPGFGLEQKAGLRELLLALGDPA